MLRGDQRYQTDFLFQLNLFTNFFQEHMQPSTRWRGSLSPMPWRFHMKEMLRQTKLLSMRLRWCLQPRLEHAGNIVCEQPQFLSDSIHIFSTSNLMQIACLHVCMWIQVHRRVFQYMTLCIYIYCLSLLCVCILMCVSCYCTCIYTCMYMYVYL